MVQVGMCLVVTKTFHKAYAVDFHCILVVSHPQNLLWQHLPIHMGAINSLGELLPWFFWLLLSFDNKSLDNEGVLHYRTSYRANLHKWFITLPSSLLNATPFLHHQGRFLVLEISWCHKTKRLLPLLWLRWPNLLSLCVLVDTFVLFLRATSILLRVSQPWRPK